MNRILAARTGKEHFCAFICASPNFIKDTRNIVLSDVIKKLQYSPFINEILLKKEMDKLDFLSELKVNEFSYKLKLTDSENDFKRVDLVLTFGGDGSILWANRYTNQSHSPLFITFNCGNIGFLSHFLLDDVDWILSLFDQNNNQEDFRIIDFPKIVCSIFKDGKLIGNLKAVNEITIHRNQEYFIQLDLSISDQPLITINADGIILSSELGSTAYNSSLNGPIIYPSSGTIILNSIAPFGINFRPIVLPKGLTIKAKIKDRSKNSCYSIVSDSNERILINEPGYEFQIFSSESEKISFLSKNHYFNSWCSKVKGVFNW